MSTPAASGKGDMETNVKQSTDVEKRKGSYKTTACGEPGESGSHDAELKGKASSLYDKAVSNRGSGMGEDALRKR